MKRNYDDYILFLLGADDFYISHEIRALCQKIGMDGAYECCQYIAQQFEKFDKHHTQISQYDSFTQFLELYHDNILDYIDMDIKIQIKESDFM